MITMAWLTTHLQKKSTRRRRMATKRTTGIGCHICMGSVLLPTMASIAMLLRTMGSNLMGILVIIATGSHISMAWAVANGRYGVG
mmetsp:Transcript_81359/g.141185  ORF Transcript_81359/g.141185 Transcript_81359/m.141185 type:complete len:85 (+) Transcript_81359:1400-1654(+)